MTDLVRDVAAEVRPPDFDTLVRRAERRRVRRRVSALVAAATVVAVTAVGAASLRSTDDATPLPTNPSPTVSSSTTVVHSGLPVDIQGLIRTATLTSYAVDGHGDLVTQWHTCIGGTCRSLYDVRSNDAHPYAYGSQDDATAGSPTFVPAGRGFLDLQPAGAPLMLFRDGSTTAVPQKASGTVAAETVIAPGPDTKVGLLAMDPSAQVWWPLPRTGCSSGQQGWAGATISDAGRIWAFPVVGIQGGQVPLCSSDDGIHWHLAISNLNPDPAAAPGEVVAVGRRVVALSAGDDGMPADPFWVSNDDGAHFSKVSGLPFDRVDSMAATSDGVLYVADMAGDIYRSVDWTTFTKIAAPKLWGLQADGTSVAGQGGDLDHPAIYTIDGAGAVGPWPTPLR